ncbi:MAG: hypothetical protein QXP31_11705 [Pyrobaculum sp.]
MYIVYRRVVKSGRRFLITLPPELSNVWKELHEKDKVLKITIEEVS